MRPAIASGRLAVTLVLAATCGITVPFLATFVRAAQLVDMVPGADAGIATSPALEAARAQAAMPGIALLVNGIGTRVVL